MPLSNDLISQFAKITKDEKSTKNETTLYGTAVKFNGKMYAKLDGSDRMTPIETTVDVKEGERVTVLVKNHTATITGNISSPAARTDDLKDTTKKVEDIGSQISEFEIIIADKVSTKQLEAAEAKIDDLKADNVTIKNTLTANKADIDDLKADNVTIKNTLTANKADIDDLKANTLTVEIANAKYATVENLKATDASIHNLTADYGDFKSATTDTLTANKADIDDLKANTLTVEIANAKYATIETLNANYAKITDLEAANGNITLLSSKVANIETLKADIAYVEELTAKKIDAETADIKYANIDFANIGTAAIEKFFSQSGMIKDLVVGDQTIAGELVGVTIRGDLIEGNTIVADKLVIKGTDGLYYKLNTDGNTTEAEQTDYNSLNGSVIRAKSITASKIAVNDLFAFNATIAGFHITDTALYSGAKSSATNGTRGIYLGKDGQMAIGDGTHYIKYYKQNDDSFKLAISAENVEFTSGKSLTEEMNTLTQTVEDLKSVDTSVVEYQVGTSGTTAPTGEWDLGVPTVATGQYLWTRTTITYNDGTSTILYSVSSMGEKGEQGDPGSPGDKGADAITVTITASNGTVFKNNSGSSILTAHVYLGGVEQSITDAGVCGSLGSIKWYKGSSTTSIATAKAITVSASDVTNSLVYTCQLEV